MAKYPYPKGAVFYPTGEIPKRELIGYERQKCALIGVAREVASGESKTVLVFGYPGTGKSIATLALASDMKRIFDIDFSMAHIWCSSIISSCVFCPDLAHRAVERDALDAVAEKAIKNRPTLICLDEIDAVVDTSEPSARSSFSTHGLELFWEDESREL